MAAAEAALHPVAAVEAATDPVPGTARRGLDEARARPPPTMAAGRGGTQARATCTRPCRPLAPQLGLLSLLEEHHRLAAFVNRRIPNGTYGGVGGEDCLRLTYPIRRACSTAWRWKSSPNLKEVKGSEPQGRHREVASGGSGEQRHEPMDKNRIRGVSVTRAGKRPRSVSPSRARSVNPAVACGQRSSLSREVCVVSRTRD